MRFLLTLVLFVEIQLKRKRAITDIMSLLVSLVGIKQ